MPHGVTEEQVGDLYLLWFKPNPGPTWGCGASTSHLAAATAGFLRGRAGCLGDKFWSLTPLTLPPNRHKSAVSTVMRMMYKLLRREC